MYANRVIELWVPGTTHRFGSGYLVGRRLILTAHHVVESVDKTKGGRDKEWMTEADLQRRAQDPEQILKVRLLSSEPGDFSDAVVVWRHQSEDVALVAATSAEWAPPARVPTSWSDLYGVTPVKCLAIGFPSIDVSLDDVHDSREVEGTILPASRIRERKWAVQLAPGIGSAPRTTSAWAGMSGAAVFVGKSLVGVIESDIDRKDPTRLELLATRTIHFADDPDFLAWLGWDAGREAWVKAAAPEHALEENWIEVSLPAATTLIGRDQQTKSVIDRLLKDSTAAVLSGLPGAGKTALAATVANHSALWERYPDGRLWLPVGKHGTTGLTPWVNRMAIWASRLGVNRDQIDEAQRHVDRVSMANLVHDALSMRRALLVFDDVWEEEDAELFKDIGSQCGRILSTRIPAVAWTFIDSKEDRIERLPDLERDESIELINRYCPRASDLYSDRLEAVVETASGLPLTLVLIGKRLSYLTGVHGTAAGQEFLEDVLSARVRLKLRIEVSRSDPNYELLVSHRTLEAVIDLTAESLNEDDRRALWDISTFPPKANTFSREAADRVAGDRDRVTSLIDNALVEKTDLQGRRYTMHQAIADYAHDREIDPSALHRMATYYVEYITAVCQTGDSGKWAALLEVDLENIRAAFNWAIRQRESYLALQLVAVLWPYLYERSRFQLGLELAQHALKIANKKGLGRRHKLLRAKVLNDAGNYAYNMSILELAERYHRQSLQIRQELQEEALTAGSINNIGLLARERGDYGAALDNFSRALEINERTEHENWQLWSGMNLNNMGVAYYRMGDQAKAQTYQQRSIERFSSIGKDWGVAMARLNMFESLVEEGATPSVELAQVLRERQALKDAKAAATALRVGASLALRRGDGGVALRRNLAAFALSAPITDRLGEGAALEGTLLAAAAIGDSRVGARTAGVLEAYRRLSSVAPAPWQAQRLAAALARLRDQAGKEFDRGRTSGETAVGDSLSHLSDAMKGLLSSGDPDVEIATLLESGP